MCLCINSLIPIFLFLLLMLSQATTPSHSVRPCQLLRFRLLLWFPQLLNPSAVTLFSGPTALHFISFFIVSSLLYGGRILLSWPTLCSCAISRGSAWNFMSWWEYASLCQHAVLVLDAVLSLLVQLWFCLFDGEGGRVSCSEVFCLIGVVAVWQTERESPGLGTHYL